jgi:hypothetical protein
MSTSPREILLVGSLPLRPAAKAFEMVAQHLGTLAPRYPDGEQLGWVRAAFQSFQQNPALEVSRQVPLQAKGVYPQNIFRLRPGLTAKDLTLGPYGYAKNAASSYAQFKRLRDEEKIPPHTRLQVTMPGPGTSAYVVELPAEELLPIARSALFGEVQQILSTIPANDLTIQLDIAMEAEHEEYLRHPKAWDAPMHTVFHWTQEQMADSVAWLANRIPPEVELGFHICSIWHHDPSPGQDNAVLADTANAIALRVTRPIDYVHIPIIPDHMATDFAALGRLELKPGEKLYLGLINLADGIEGARRRIRMAETVFPDFGVGMFCGLGLAEYDRALNIANPPIPALRRATPETIGAVLDLHRDVAGLE